VIGLPNGYVFGELPENNQAKQLNCCWASPCVSHSRFLTHALTAPTHHQWFKPRPPVSYPYALCSCRRILNPINLVLPGSDGGDKQLKGPPVLLPDATAKALADLAKQMVASGYGTMAFSFPCLPSPPRVPLLLGRVRCFHPRRTRRFCLGGRQRQSAGRTGSTTVPLHGPRVYRALQCTALLYFEHGTCPEGLSCSWAVMRSTSGSMSNSGSQGTFSRQCNSPERMSAGPRP
jgi:hypothetical protein